MPSGIRVRFASGRVKVFTPSEYAELPSAWLVGARTELVFDVHQAAPGQRAGRAARAAIWLGEHVDRALRWLVSR